MKNDLAIIYIEKPIEFDEHVKPACMPKTKISFGSTCYVSGWGNIKNVKDDDPEKPTDLMTAPLNVYSKSKCYQETLKENENVTYELFNSFYDELIPGGICASNRPKSVCQGDSGGPFICEENGKAVIRGITSGLINVGLYFMEA